jgi:tRNA-dihydrouridine synthase B
MRIGSHLLKNGLFVAPMAGVSDRAWRRLCRRYGAGLAVSEMVGAGRQLRDTVKSRRRINHDGESGPISVQIVGNEPDAMAEAARFNAGEGADIIDINMGCPAKKVCNKAAGSALLRDETLVARILQAVVSAVDVPVTLKFRTGWDEHTRNALQIARIAEESGIQLLTLHGRTRACGFRGAAEYDTIAAVKAASRLPVIANGDIDSPERARQVLQHTGADGVMIGRGAQGKPWLFREIACELATGTQAPPASLLEIREVLLEHLEELHVLYGTELGVRIARKHAGWYVKDLPDSIAFRERFNRMNSFAEQRATITHWFDRLAEPSRLATRETRIDTTTGLASDDAVFVAAHRESALA